jgi:aryl-alcohol dehydrogenase-like predicted oxidoreductase
MQYREIAQTGIKVSPLGLGTVKFGRNQGVKYPQGFALPDDRQVRELLALSRDLGINLLDTAPAYGLSEQRLGQLMTNRQDWVIETKVGEDFKEGQSSFDFTAKGTRASIERSLRLLKTDYLDMVLIHSDGDDQRILQQEEVLDCLIELRQVGKVRAIGISSKTVTGGVLAFEKDCDVVMSCYNPIYTEERAVLQAAAEQQRGILIKKAFASGHLDKLSHSNPIETALRFIFAQAGVSSIILGTINPKHLQENVALTEKILCQLGE